MDPAPGTANAGSAKGAGASTDAVTGAVSPTAATRLPPAEQAVGAELRALRIGPFEIRRVIGQGGMGVVYEAMQDSPHRLVALKVLPPGARSASRQKRFEAETEILGRLRHTGIAQIFAAGTHRDASNPDAPPVPYYAMEYIRDGVAITEFCRARNLGMGDQLRLMVRVFEAIECAHRHGVIHRDLKPSNILVEPLSQSASGTRVDEPGVPKVIDFGIAKLMHADDAGPTLDGQAIGTVEYMSPEQILGKSHQIDERSDVYALGVVLYELTTGVLPYRLNSQPGRTPTDVITEDPPTLPTAVVPAIGTDLEIILLKCLNKDASRRYQSVQELRLDVERYLKGDAISARRDSVVYRTTRRMGVMVSRSPAAAAGLAVVLAVVGALVLGTELVFYRSPLDRWYRTAMADLAPPIQPESFDRSRLIMMSDETDLAALAESEGIQGVVPGQVPTYRLLHARLLEKLAEAGPAAIGFDIYFQSSTPHDTALLAAVERAKSRGVNVVFATSEWVSPEEAFSPSNTGPLPVPAELAAAVRWGTITGGGVSDVSYQVDLASVRPGVEIMPSLALAIFAAARHPGAIPKYAVREEPPEVEVRYLDPAATVPTRLADPDTLPVTAVSPLYADEPAFNLRAGDMLATLAFPLPPDPVFVSAIIPYSKAMRASPDELTRLVQGKSIVIANGRSDSGVLDVHEMPGGRMLPGPWSHIAGLEALYSRAALRTPLWMWSAAVTVIAGVVGGLLGRAFAGRSIYVVPVIATSVVVALAAGMVVARMHYLWNPIVPWIAFTVAFSLTVFLLELRPAISRPGAGLTSARGGIA